MSLRKRPCGVSSAAQMARPGATLVVSLEMRPCRKSTRSGPPTAITLRWETRLKEGADMILTWGLAVRLASVPTILNFYLCENESRHILVGMAARCHRFRTIWGRTGECARSIPSEIQVRLRTRIAG